MLTIGVIGRPNVGKSSLFNALLRRRRTIVLDMPGTTTDEVRENVTWNDQTLSLIDSQGVYSEGDETVIDSLTAKSDACMFIIDGQVGVTPFDKWIAKCLHQWGQPVKLLINKSDRMEEDASDKEFHQLGFGEPTYVSATQFHGIPELRNWCVERFGEKSEPVDPEKQGVVNVALIGRPNSGKSTLMNRLCGTKISRVSATPLTTRDPLAHEVETRRGMVKFVDTAGIRRPSRKKQKVEVFSINAATRSIRAADVVLLLLDCHEGISDQDMRLQELVVKEGKPTLILLNFWDCLDRDERRHFLEYSEFARIVVRFPKLEISGKTGFHVDRIIPKIFELNRKSERRIPTGRLNSLVEQMVRNNPPPAAGTKNFNILYASQVAVKPPTFVFFMNRKASLPKSYRKYVENKLKQSLDLKGQAIRVFFRGKDEKSNPYVSH